jgi:hypothetical protein
MIEILDGVKPGDRIILKPAGSVRNRARVKIAGE